jgi:hypothetical protein
MCDTSSVALAGLADQLGWPGLLRAAVDGLVGVSTDELTEDELASTMRVVQTEQTRLGNLQALLFDARRRRVVARGRQTPDGREDANAGVRAARQLEQDVAGELGIGNGDAKRIAKAGKAIARDPEAAKAAKDGAVSAEHLRVLDDKLRDIDDLDLQTRLRRELLAAAAGLDLYGFRRACDRAIAEADQAAAARAEDGRQSRRSAKTFETDDGMLGLSARLAGLGAETVATAIDAYRTPDAADQRRRPEQRTADALVDMATVALRHIDSTAHGHPPQVLVTIDRDAVLTGRGVAETVWTGPLPASVVRRLLGDAQLTTITTGRELPTEVVSHTRAVPAGLWRALVARDKGCTADGCDVPPGWCQVVHLHIDYQPGGRLSEANAALVCDRHHDTYDRPDRPLVAVWTDGRPVLVRRSQVPAGARRTPPDHLIPPGGLQGPVPGRTVPIIDPTTRQPTGRWLPAAPTSDTDGETDARSDQTATTPGRVTVDDRATVSDPTATDRTGDDYDRRPTAGQPSLLAEPRASYRTRAGPPPRGRASPAADAPSHGPASARPRGPTSGCDRHGARNRDGPETDPRPEEQGPRMRPRRRAPMRSGP